MSERDWVSKVNDLGWAPINWPVDTSATSPNLRPPAPTIVAAWRLLVGVALGAVALFALAAELSGLPSTLLRAVAGVLIGFVVIAGAESWILNRDRNRRRDGAVEGLVPLIAQMTWEYADILWRQLTDGVEVAPLTSDYLDRRRLAPDAAPDYVELRKLCALARYVQDRMEDADAERDRYIDAHSKGPPPPRNPGALVWFGGELPDISVLALYLEQQANWIEALSRSSKELAGLVEHAGLTQVGIELDTAATRLRNFAIVRLRRDTHATDAEVAERRNRALTTSAVERDQASFPGSTFPWLEEARLQEAVSESLLLVRLSLRAVIDLYSALVLRADISALEPAGPPEYRFFDDLDELETAGEAASRHAKQRAFEASIEGSAGG